MTTIINLNKVRKAKTKEQANQQAKANRALHGLTKDAKKKAMADAKKAAMALEGKKLED